MAALPKTTFQANPCFGCIYYADEPHQPNGSSQQTFAAHNFYGTHVMVKLNGQSAYGAQGIHWGNVNVGMSAGNAGDVHCGSNGSWCYENFWYSTTIWQKSMQLYVR